MDRGISRRQSSPNVVDTSAADAALYRMLSHRPAPVAAPDQAMHKSRWRQFHQYRRRAEVTAVERLTSTGTDLLTLRVVDGEDFDFEPGQFIGLAVELNGELRTRPFCVWSARSSRSALQLLVRVLPNGPLSQYLAARAPGDVLAFRGPLGRSMVPEHPGGRLDLICTGVGVGPFLGLVGHLIDLGDDRPVRLYWGLRLAEDICLTDELEALARDHPDFAYRVSLSRPPAEWRSLAGRVTHSVPPLLETLCDRHFVLCGNGAMIAELYGALYEVGVPGERIHREFYFNTRYRADPATVTAIRRRFTATDVTSPLEVFRVLGIDLDA
ncbi:MAG: ferredoxin--NADP reductase [Egibacteraceae bacterium]